MNDNLIGYILNALDESERQACEAEVRTHPERKAQLECLRKALIPLGADAGHPEVPKGLIINTFAKIAEHRCPSLPFPPALPIRNVSPVRPWFRRVDMLAAACLLVVISGLALPFIMSWREKHLLINCQNTLRQYGSALQSFAVSHNSQLPQVPARGPHNYTASFVPLLDNAGCLPSKEHLVCRGGGDSGLPLSPRMIDELDDEHHQKQFAHRAQQLAGNYAYSLGYWDKGEHHGLRINDRLPIMADHRPELTGESNSPNHGGKGQNVLFVGGNVEFLPTPFVPGTRDNIFLNEQGEIKAGIKRGDTVLGSGETRP